MKVQHHIPTKTIGTDAFFHNVDIRKVDELVFLDFPKSVGVFRAKNPTGVFLKTT